MLAQSIVTVVRPTCGFQETKKEQTPKKTAKVRLCVGGCLSRCVAVQKLLEPAAKWSTSTSVPGRNAIYRL
jgi:hypothetical protein